MCVEFLTNWSRRTSGVHYREAKTKSCWPIILVFLDELLHVNVFEKKILRKIYGPICDRGEWRIRWNQELYDIDDIDVVKRIKIQRLR